VFCSFSRRIGWLAHVALVLFGLGLAHPARAQSCHVPPTVRDQATSVRVLASAFAASYGTGAYVGEYQGGALFGSYALWRLQLSASLPYYRIVRNGLSERGLGDVFTSLRATLLERELSPIDHVQLGLDLAQTLPSGDRIKGLGMGHVMLMPGLFARLMHGRTTLELGLAYGRALASGSAHDHGPWPLVNPMNLGELEHSVSALYRVTDWLIGSARLHGAVPIADKHGAAREIIGLGALAQIGPAELSLEQELPLAGNPIRSRTTVRVGASF
jgi:hypothetical protein